MFVHEVSVECFSAVGEEPLVCSEQLLFALGELPVNNCVCFVVLHSSLEVAFIVVKHRVPVVPHVPCDAHQFL